MEEVVEKVLAVIRHYYDGPPSGELRYSRHYKKSPSGKDEVIGITVEALPNFRIDSKNKLCRFKLEMSLK